MVLIHKGLFPSISTFETPPAIERAELETLHLQLARLPSTLLEAESGWRHPGLGSRTEGEGPQPLGMSRNKGTQRTRKLSTENARWMLRKWEGRLLTYARRWTKGGEPDAVKAASPVRRRG
jgi:hypothetical protein